MSSDTPAWHLRHRVRNGMVNETRCPLSGLIEADARIIGGPANGNRGRGGTAAPYKSLIIGAVEVIAYENTQGTRCERAGRRRRSTVDHAGAVPIRDVLARQVEAGSTVRTDGWPGYADEARVGNPPRMRVVRPPERAHQVAPHVHRVFSNLNAWLNGPHHGGAPRYLQRYLDECVFRFNRRNTPMAAFQPLLGTSSQNAPLPLRDLLVLSQP